MFYTPVLGKIGLVFRQKLVQLPADIVDFHRPDTQALEPYVCDLINSPRWSRVAGIPG